MYYRAKAISHAQLELPCYTSGDDEIRTLNDVPDSRYDVTLISFNNRFQSARTENYLWHSLNGLQSSISLSTSELEILCNFHPYVHMCHMFYFSKLNTFSCFTDNDVSRTTITEYFYYLSRS